MRMFFDRKVQDGAATSLNKWTSSNGGELPDTDIAVLRQASEDMTHVQQQPQYAEQVSCISSMQQSRFRLAMSQNRLHEIFLTVTKGYQQLV